MLLLLPAEQGNVDPRFDGDIAVDVVHARGDLRSACEEEEDARVVLTEGLVVPRTVDGQGLTAVVRLASPVDVIFGTDLTPGGVDLSRDDVVPDGLAEVEEIHVADGVRVLLALLTVAEVLLPEGRALDLRARDVLQGLAVLVVRRRTGAGAQEDHGSDSGDDDADLTRARGHGEFHFLFSLQSVLGFESSIW